MRIAAIVFILAFFPFLVIHTGVVICRWLKAVFPGLKPLLFGLIFGILLICAFGAFLFSRVSHVPRALLLFIHYGLGVVIYGLLFVNLIALLLCLGKAVHLIATPQPATVSTAALCLSAVLVLGLPAWGLCQANTIHTVAYTIDVSNIAAPVKIALISDLHIGYAVDEIYLQKIVSQINRMSPDIVCIAGDIFDGDLTAISDPEAIKSAFRSINAPIYACLGNHDAGESYWQVLHFLSDAGIRVLLDETVVVDNRILLVGRRDSSLVGAHGESRTAVRIPECSTMPVIVLDHQPGNIAQYGKDVDLILCGHTHRGQLFPVDIITAWIYDRNYGYYPSSDTAPQVIVTSGAGTSGPMLRLGTANEVVIIHIQ